MSDVVSAIEAELRSEELRRAGICVFLRVGGMVRVDGRTGRIATVTRSSGRTRLEFTRGKECVAEYAVCEWTPRHTDAVLAWTADAFVDEELEGMKTRLDIIGRDIRDAAGSPARWRLLNDGRRLAVRRDWRTVYVDDTDDGLALSLEALDGIRDSETTVTGTFRQWGPALTQASARFLWGGE